MMERFLQSGRSGLVRIYGAVVLLVMLFSLTCCNIQPPKHKTPAMIAKEKLTAGANENMQEQKRKESKTIPDSIKSALMPNVGDSDTAHNTLYNKRFTLVVNNISAPLFFQKLRKDTPYNIIVDPQISGTISLNLKDVTVPQIFETLRDLYGYEFTKTNAGFEVSAPKMQSQIFRVNYLDVKRVVDSKTSLATSDLIDAGTETASSGGSAPVPSPGAVRASSVTNSVETTSSIAFWDSLSDSLKTLIGTDGGRSITVNSNSGVVVVKAYPSELRQAREFIDRLQSSVNRQVILEVSILEVQLNDAFQAGINWKLLGLTTNMGPPGVAGIDPFTTITMTDGTNESVISLLKQQGNVQVLSSPRVLTVNNQQSVIKVGTENYYVTGITNTPVSTTSSTGSATTTTSSSVSLTPFFSGITLNITPQIDYNSQVMLHVHPTVSVVKQEQKTIDLGTGEPPMILPTASESLREYDSIVRASNNQLIVIGGMITNSISESLGGLPGISNIPFFGTLFRSNTQVSDKTELVIVLKPLLVTEQPQGLIDDFNSTRTRMNDLDRGFHEGGIVDMLGNQGEASNI